MKEKMGKVMQQVQDKFFAEGKILSPKNRAALKKGARAVAKVAVPVLKVMGLMTIIGFGLIICILAAWGRYEFYYHHPRKAMLWWSLWG